MASRSRRLPAVDPAQSIFRSPTVEPFPALRRRDRCFAFPMNRRRSQRSRPFRWFAPLPFLHSRLDRSLIAISKLLGRVPLDFNSGYAGRVHVLITKESLQLFTRRFFGIEQFGFLDSVF